MLKSRSGTLLSRRGSGNYRRENQNKNSMKNIWKLLYPDVCPFCGKVNAKGPCTDCLKKLSWIKEPMCKKCGKPVGDEQTEYCRDCRERIEDGNCWFDRGRSLWTHRPPVSGSIYQFKFKNRRVYARYYAETMKERLGKQIQKWKVQAILPVPMDKWKKRKRGYNQAEIMAEELGKLTGIPVETGLIRKRKTSDAQKSLNRRGRAHNLEGTFRVERKTGLPERVLLIDDIYTTGNTVNEAAKTLKKSGVRRVFFLTISIGQDI